MTRVTMHSLLEILRGRPHARRATPDEKSRPSPFREQARFAKWAPKEYPIYTQLAAGRPGVTPYDVAVSDCFHPPVIHRILCKGGRILVQASDNVLVKEVKVAVCDERGNILAWGNAVRLEGDWWEFLTRVEGKKITVMAWDLPGNQARLDLE